MSPKLYIAPGTTGKKRPSRHWIGWSRRRRDNASRGHRQKENTDGLIPCAIEQLENARPNRNWARLIQKIYQVDPLICPKCQGMMLIISIIEHPVFIDKILSHLGLNQKTQRPPPKAKALDLQIDYSDSQLPDYEEAVPDHDVFPDYSIG